MKHILIFFIQLGLFTPTFAAVDVLDLDGKTKIAQYERTADGDKAGKGSIQTRYLDLNGQVLLTEKGIFEGGKIKSYEIDHKQTGESGKIAFNGDLVLFQFQDKQKKAKSNTEPQKGNMIAPLSLIPMIEEKIEALAKGETIDVRVAVWYRLDSVGMVLSKVSDSPLGQPADSHIIQMKPANFIISKLVKPLYFQYSTLEKRVTLMRGRLPIKKANGSSFDDVDGLLPIQKL